ncbi:secreted protein [Bathymodiolus azoricus thioautotrophic gill symbiont]|uniref:Secreted protein n=1 Tax=Bathymodiolus azoricus thioautotrophic gill symbiont TaxID=235205 RepID=A0A1H6JN62_9GAMM|nr:secreted protein [Bathymodiolus azoricus thioautotrophic gill symbiont]
MACCNCATMASASISSSGLSSVLTIYSPLSMSSTKILTTLP